MLKKCLMLIVSLFLLAGFQLKASSLTPVLVKEVSGGFVPPEFDGWGLKVIVYENGQVIESYRPNYQSPWQETLLAQLPSNIVDELSNKVKDIEPGAIIFPDEPICMDIPRTVYKGRNQAGILVDFAQDINCRLGLLDNFYSALTLQKILDGFDALFEGR